MRQIGILLGIVGAAFIGRVRTKAGSRPQGHTHVRSLSALTRSLAEAHDIGEILTVLEYYFVTVFGFPLAIVLLEEDQPRVRLCTATFTPNRADMAAAGLAMRYGRRAGRGTADVPEAHSSFLPLVTWQGVIGAIGFKAGEDQKWIARDEWPVLESFVHQAALAVLRGRLQEQAHTAALLHESDKLQKALLNSISHNVRTPLAAVIGSLSTLQEDQHELSETTKRELIDSARMEAERLNRLLGNLLDMSRLEAGTVRARTDLSDVQDVIGAALEQLGGMLYSRSVQVMIPPDLPFVRMDFVLIVQVLVNLLDNALKYSPTDTPISLEARVTEQKLEISVYDNGDGIPEKDLKRVFEKFNRTGRTGETAGMGLGLSICKGFVEAHKGRIWAERRDPCGTAVKFTLPLDGRSQG